MTMRSFAAATVLAMTAVGLVAPAVTAASGAPTSRQVQAQPQPRHPDDMGADDERLLGMQGPYALVLLLGGLVASLILIRGPALRRASQSVKRIPGDAP